jgi:hypothetical protein
MRSIQESVLEELKESEPGIRRPTRTPLHPLTLDLDGAAAGPREARQVRGQRVRLGRHVDAARLAQGCARGACACACVRVTAVGLGCGRWGGVRWSTCWAGPRSATADASNSEMAHGRLPPQQGRRGGLDPAKSQEEVRGGAADAGGAVRCGAVRCKAKCCRAGHSHSMREHTLTVSPITAAGEQAGRGSRAHG